MGAHFFLALAGSGGNRDLFQLSALTRPGTAGRTVQRTHRRVCAVGGGGLIKIYDGYDLFWNLGEKKPFL